MSLKPRLWCINKTASNLCCSHIIYVRGRYHQEPSSQFITLMSQIFPVKNSNLQSSGLVGLVAKSSVFKTGKFWNLLSSHLRFWVSFNLLSSQGLIFRLPKNPVTPPCQDRNDYTWQCGSISLILSPGIIVTSGTLLILALSNNSSNLPSSSCSVATINWREIENTTH